MENWSLSGKIAVVTGAAGGIGAAISRKFAAAGARLVLADLSEKSLLETRATLADADGHGVCPGDLGSIEACSALVDYTLEKYGGIDVLVNAAAFLRRAPLAEVDREYWQRTVAVNMAAPFFLARACIAPMKKRKSGRIILFSSQGAFTGGFYGSAVYAMTKAAVVALAKSLSRELAPDGICVNSIAPGAIDTPMLRGGMSEQALREFLATIPAGRLGAPEEAADACLFLASDASSYITGHTLDVNGGQLMR